MRRLVLSALILSFLSVVLIHAQEMPLPMKKPTPVPIPEKRPADLYPVINRIETTQDTKNQRNRIPEEKKLEPKQLEKSEKKTVIIDWQTNSKKTIPLPIRDPRRMALGDQNIIEWPSLTISKAQQFCKTILKDIPVTYDAIPPIRKGACGSPAPILLKSVGSEPVVKIKPPARINCKMAKALYIWMKNKTQPAALTLLNSPIVEIKNIASYSCRNRYSNPFKKISEHAFANALDIAGFKTHDNQDVILLRDWGPTARDIRYQARKEERLLRQLALKKQEEKQKATGTLAKKKDQTGLQIIGREETYPRVIPLPVRKADYLKGPHLDNKAKFLHKIHEEACGIFGTVLGPESNEAHRNHFHFDLAPRKFRAYCE